MKTCKNFALALVVLTAVSCDFKSNENTSTEGTKTETNVGTYTAADGDITKKDGVVMVHKNGSWVALDKEISLGNGITVSTSGEVNKDGKLILLDDGGFINKAGDFFDKTGATISNVWDKAKDAAAHISGNVTQEAAKAVDAIQQAAPKSVEAAKDGLQKGLDKVKEEAQKIGAATQSGVNAAKDE